MSSWTSPLRMDCAAPPHGLSERLRCRPLLFPLSLAPRPHLCAHPFQPKPTMRSTTCRNQLLGSYFGIKPTHVSALIASAERDKTIRPRKGSPSLYKHCANDSGGLYCGPRKSVFEPNTGLFLNDDVYTGLPVLNAPDSPNRSRRQRTLLGRSPREAGVRL